MKKNLLLISLLISMASFAQVGINTETPKATLDVVGAPTDLTKVDGVIAPRISGNDLANKDALYTAAQTGAILYVTAGVAVPTAKTINVTSIGYYYFDGAVWIKMTSPIVTADNGLTKTGNNIQLGGTLLKNTEIATAGFNTTFSGTGRIGIGTNNPFSQLSNSASVAANDNSGRGINAVTGINWTTSGGAYGMILNNSDTSGTGSGLFIKTNSSDILSRPLHVMSGSNNVLTATGNARVGIGVEQPSNTLDVNGDVRVRTINTNVGNGTSDRRVVADANGVLKTIDNDDYNFFHARLISDQTLSSDALTNTVLFGTPIATSPFYSYNTSTGVFTFNSSGLYFITYQGGFSDFAAGSHLLLGIINVATGQYIGRGSNWSALARSGTVGQISNYTTMINVPSSGYQVRFIAYAGASGSAVLLANETGISGSGNVTNLTIQKTR